MPVVWGEKLLFSLIRSTTREYSCTARTTREYIRRSVRICKTREYIRRSIRILRLANKLGDQYGSYDSWIHYTLRTGRTTRDYIGRSVRVVRLVNTLKVVQVIQVVWINKSVLPLVTIRGIGQPSNSKGDNLFKEKNSCLFSNCMFIQSWRRD